jgi:hypothetical protein
MKAGISAFLVIALGGCADIVFSEADEGQTRDLFLGTTFSVSLPASSEERRPQLKGTIIRFLGCHLDESTGRDVFEFKAQGLGEDTIGIRRAHGGPAGKEYFLHVRIKSVSDEPSVQMHQH